MILNKKSMIEARGFLDTFDLYPMYDDWEQELYNYFILGFQPGSFHTALFANDLTMTALESHPPVRWAWIQAMCKWNFANAPAGSTGSYENVARWLDKTAVERRIICEGRGWLLTEEELSWKIVSDKG
jgi:hypothetical protein